jgi:hypothetical protein
MELAHMDFHQLFMNISMVSATITMINLDSNFSFFDRFIIIRNFGNNIYKGKK